MYIHINFTKDFFHKHDKGLNLASYAKKPRRGTILGPLRILGPSTLLLNKREFCFPEMSTSSVHGFTFIDRCLFPATYLHYVSSHISHLTAKFRILYSSEDDSVTNLYICQGPI